MYNWEIKDFLNKSNYFISYSMFLDIVRSSPQIDHIKYDPWKDCINMWDKDGNSFEFKIYKN